MKNFNKHFTFPFKLHDFQEEAVKTIISRKCSLLKFSVGLGKTACATNAALRLSLDKGVEQIIVICPPVLLLQWSRFLESIGGIPDVLVYQGTPTERAAMSLDAAVIVVSYNIFRGTKTFTGDYQRFQKLAKTRKLCIIADELSLKSLRSQTYQKLKLLIYEKIRPMKNDEAIHYLIALNATPLSSLDHVFNWLILMQPGVYPSLREFECKHVFMQDHWGKSLSWKNTDLLDKNFSRITVDTDREVALPPIVETVTPYTLTKAHMKLYKEVKEAELNNLPADKIELAINSMFSTLQRLVLVPEEFGLNIRSPVLDFIEGYLDQLQPEDGVLIFTRHKIVSRLLAEKVPDCVAVYGDVPKSEREKAFEQLKSGTCKRLVGNLQSLGQGLNLQMLNHVIYIELPFRDDMLIQSTGRVHRQLQTKTCFVNFPLATGTIQDQIYHKLLKNKEDLSVIMKTKDRVREFLDSPREFLDTPREFLA